MKRIVYSIVRRRKVWHVCAEGRLEPLAIYVRRDDAMRYALEAVRQRNEIYDDHAEIGASAHASDDAPRRIGRPHLEIVQ
ncbi:MAG: hypothetical protein J7507_04985 [Pseudoxanthomonas sp.]|nr:hypothetical protein [Pseudoxanthomonas sp.]